MLASCAFASTRDLGNSTGSFSEESFSINAADSNSKQISFVFTPSADITQLPIDECKDWILHALGIKDQYCTIRYAIYNKWEFLIVNSIISFECYPDVNILTKIEKTTGMSLIKATRKLHGSSVEELWFGRSIEHKKLQQWITDLISWSIYCRYKNLN